MAYYGDTGCGRLIYSITHTILQAVLANKAQPEEADTTCVP